MINQDLTLLIATHNRHRYLERCLHYYAPLLSQGVKIIIGDSSAEPFSDQELLKGVDYHRYPGLGYAKKLTALIGMLNTKYVMIVADDDYVTPTGLSTCLKFLDDNPEYSCALGTYLVFNPNSGRPRFSLMYPHIYRLDLNQRTPAERIQALFRNYFQTYYAVHRSSNVKGYGSYMAPLKEESKFTEKLFAIITAANGKNKVLPVFYSAREHIPGSASSSWVHLDTLSRDPKYKEEYRIFIDTVASYLTNNFNVPASDARSSILDSFEYHIEELIENKKNRAARPLPAPPLRPGIKARVKGKILRIMAKAGMHLGPRIVKTEDGEKFGFYQNANGDLHFYDRAQEQDLEAIKKSIISSKGTFSLQVHK